MKGEVNAGTKRKCNHPHSAISTVTEAMSTGAAHMERTAARCSWREGRRSAADTLATGSARLLGYRSLPPAPAPPPPFTQGAQGRNLKPRHRCMHQLSSFAPKLPRGLRRPINCMPRRTGRTVHLRPDAAAGAAVDAHGAEAGGGRRLRQRLPPRLGARGSLADRRADHRVGAAPRGGARLAARPAGRPSAT